MYINTFNSCACLLLFVLDIVFVTCSTVVNILFLSYKVGFNTILVVLLCLLRVVVYSPFVI